MFPGGNPSSSMSMHPLMSLLRAPAKVTLQWSWSYVDTLVAQGLGPINSLYHRDCFTRLKATIPQGQTANTRVVPGKVANYSSSDGTGHVANFMCDLRRYDDVNCALRDLRTQLDCSNGKWRGLLRGWVWAWTQTWIQLD